MSEQAVHPVEFLLSRAASLRASGQTREADAVRVAANDLLASMNRDHVREDLEVAVADSIEETVAHWRKRSEELKEQAHGDDYVSGYGEGLSSCAWEMERALRKAQGVSV